MTQGLVLTQDAVDDVELAAGSYRFKSLPVSATAILRMCSIQVVLEGGVQGDAVSADDAIDLIGPIQGVLVRVPDPVTNLGKRLYPDSSDQMVDRRLPIEFALSTSPKVVPGSWNFVSQSDPVPRVATESVPSPHIVYSAVQRALREYEFGQQRGSRGIMRQVLVIYP